MSLASLRTVDLFIAGEPGALVTVTETAQGDLDFKVRVTDLISGNTDRLDVADLRGLFFHVANESLLQGLSLKKPVGSSITDHQINANKVIQLGGGTNMNGEVGKEAGKFDIGIEFGSPGIGHGDDIREATFSLSSTKGPLKLEFVLGQQFGLRLTSVSENGVGRELSLKLLGTMPPVGDPVASSGNSPTPNPPPTEQQPVETPTTPPPATETPTTNPPVTPTPSPQTPTPNPPVETVDGAAYDDLIEGGDGNDSIYGGLGNDEMQGEGGNDLIVGGRDNGRISWKDDLLTLAIGDNLYGNDGDDTFIYGKGDGVDLIWDFQPGMDVIKLSDYNRSDIFGFTYVNDVSNYIGTPTHQKIAIILNKDGDAIVFNDYPHPSDGDVAIRFADGTTISSGEIKRLAEANPLRLGQVDYNAVDRRDVSALGNSGKTPLDLFGNNGEDILIGGLSHDRLYGNEGVNGLNGRAGNDRLYGGNVRDTLLGDVGDDIGYGNGGDDIIIGGGGSDNLYGAGGADIIYGDDGQGIDIPTSLTTYPSVNPGEEVGAKIKITKTWWGGFQGEITVTATESVNRWGIFLQSKFNIDSIWGARAVGEASWSQGITYDLDNEVWNGSLASGQTTTIGFTARTGVNGVVEAEHLIPGLAVVKQISTEALPGEAAVSALGNTLRGQAGADTLVGTARSDTYYVDNKGDKVFEKSAGGASDEVIASVSYTLASNVEKITAATSKLNLTLKGNKLNNAITGSEGANKLYGGTGKDSFIFNVKPSEAGIDTIADYSVKDDSIRLEDKIFKKLGSPGKLKASFFTIGSAAEDKNDYLVYNQDTGILSYDADGSGRGKAVGVAKFKQGLELTHSEFFII